MVVVVFLLILLAIAGVLGVVLKAALLMVMTAALFAIACAWLVRWAVRRQLVRAQQALERTGTQIRIGRVVRSPDGASPPPVDDRY